MRRGSSVCDFDLGLRPGADIEGWRPCYWTLRELRDAVTLHVALRQFVDRTWLEPGRPTLCRKTILSPAFLTGWLHDGFDFAVPQGKLDVGPEPVQTVLNEKPSKNV